MRAVAILAVVCGCGFRVPGASDDTTIVDAAVDAAADAAPDGFVPLPACMTNAAYSNGPNAGHRYRKTDDRDRDGAFDACAADGAHIATIESAAEDMHVHSVGAGGDIWIGLDDLASEATFRWVTGEPLGFEHFEGTEPNDNGVEDCVYQHASDLTWNDTSCADLRPAVCECEAGYKAPATPVCRSKAGFVTHDGRRYFIHEGGGSAKNWADAEADCETIGAHLAAFSDNDEDDAVDKEFLGESWIGLSDTATEGLFKWVDGNPLVFTHWNATSPHGASTVRSCVRVDITWEDQDCTLLKEYACECEP